eukprot:SAG31_NODE_44433_length_263_cov_0.506098_1_plen_20_part_01
MAQIRQALVLITALQIILAV